jgi:hypothetical protein
VTKIRDLDSNRKSAVDAADVVASNKAGGCSPQGLRQCVEDNLFTLFADRIGKKEPPGRERAILL